MRTQYTRPQRGALLRITGPVLLPVLILLLSALFLAGCASQASCDGAPKGNNRPIDPLRNNGRTIGQPITWQPIASDVAASVRKALEDRPDLMDKPIFIPPPTGRTFPMIFFNLLKTELVSRGLQVANWPEENNVDLNFSLYRVRNDGSARRPFDVVIVARMFYHNRYVMHKSGIYRIPEDSRRLYATTDRGFIGGNFPAGDPGQQEADALWRHYAVRAQAFTGPQPPQTFRRQSGQGRQGVDSPAMVSGSVTRVFHSGMVTQEEIDNTTGRRIDPNAPPPELSSFRSRKR